MPELKMTPEEIRAHVRASIKQMEREAKEWEEADNRRIKEEMKRKNRAFQKQSDKNEESQSRP